MRDVKIESSHWTTCANFHRPSGEIIGPLYAIVCEVRNRKGGYTRIPYFDGCRVDTVQPDARGDSVVRFVDGSGRQHEFVSVSDYLEFYEKSGRKL
jgi:hypothetical protein